MLPNSVRLPPPVGLTWHTPHFKPVRTARYGSAREAAGASKTAASIAATTVPVFITPPLLLCRRPVLYPRADHVDRGLRQIRSAIRHAIAQRLRAFELLDYETSVRISGNHADQVRIAGTRDIDEISGAESRIEPQPLLRGRAAVAAGNGAVHVKNVGLDGIQRRRERSRAGAGSARRRRLPALIEPLAAAGAAGGEGKRHDRDSAAHRAVTYGGRLGDRRDIPANLAGRAASVTTGTAEVISAVNVEVKVVQEETRDVCHRHLCPESREREIRPQSLVEPNCDRSVGPRPTGV